MIRNQIKGLWKDNLGSYHYHTPVTYDIVAKDKAYFSNVIVEENKLHTFNLKNEQDIVDTFQYYRLSDDCHLIRVKHIYDHKYTKYGEKLLYDYAFWIPRRLIRRGPNSWKRKTNRYGHKETLEKCIERAIDKNNPMYEAVGYYW